MASDSLDGKIVQLSRSRAVLALLIAKIDQELVTLKTQRNAVVPLGRLPTEVLIEIFKHVQLGHCDLNEWFEKLPGVPRDWKRMIPDHEWTRILAVNSRLRTVAVAVPELWAYACTSWPIKWRQVYSQRGGIHHIRLAYYITSQQRAEKTSHLLDNASHAVLYFEESKTSPGWNEDYLAALKTQSHTLQFLTIQAHRSRMANLPMTPGVLAGFGQLSHLNVDIRQGTQVEDTFSFPATLTSLRLACVIISCSTDRVRALLEGLPRLEYLEVSSFPGAPAAAITPSDSSIKIPIVDLPLQSLQMRNCQFELLHTILQLLPVPRRVLQIDCQISSWRSSSSNGTAQHSIAHVIRDYGQRFWLSRTGNTALPPATLYAMSVDPPHGESRIEMHAGGKWDTHDMFRLVLPCHPVAADDILLPYVTEVHLNKQGTLTTRVEDTWSTFCDLPALQTIHINCYRAWETVKDVKMWADSVRSSRPVTVHFSSYIGYGNTDLKLFWELNDEPLKETAWSAYIAAEHALQRLPDSDNEKGS
jgi:hypothetical protein